MAIEGEFFESLIDVCELVPVIVEDKGPKGPMVIGGVFQRSDVKNANKRTYPRGIWERVCAESSPQQRKIAARGMLGQLEHPKDGVTRLGDVSHTVTNLSLDEKGQVIGRIELFDTEEGLNAQALVRRRARLGISSRGSGSVNSDGVVQEDYNLETFDLVYNPSTPDAFPTPVREESEPETPPVGDVEEEMVTPVQEKEEERKEDLTMNVLEQFRAAQASVRPLLTEDVTALRRFELPSLQEKLLEANVKLGSLAGEDASVAGAVTGLQAQIAAKQEEVENLLREGFAAGDAGGAGSTPAGDPPPADPDAGADDEEGDDDNLGLSEDTPIERVLAENRSLSTLLFEAGRAIDEWEEKYEAAEQIAEAMTEKSGEVASQVDILESKLAAAIALIQGISESEFEDAIEEEVEAMIEQVPALEPVREMLLEASSVEEVQERAECITEAMPKRKKRHGDALPEGQDFDGDEDDDGEGVQPLSEDAPKSAKLAADALKRIGGI